jgi:hypothetical protein
MLGSRTGRFSRRRALAGAVAAFLPLLALPASAVANDPPVVTNAAVTPGSVTYLGGVVTLTANVTDDSNLLNDVFVQVIRGPIHFEAALSQGPGTDEFSGTVELPPNFTPGPVSWQLYVRARDTDLAEGVGYAGQVQVDAEPLLDEPPSVYGPAVSPRDLPSSGGPVALEVSATDLFGIEQAYATITGPGGTKTYVVLDPIGGDRFKGVFNAPAHPETSPLQYHVEMTALDRRFQPTTVDGGLITEAAAPPTGQLKVAPTSVSFGSATVGSGARRSIVLRNDGKKSTAPVSGLLVTPGAPFFLVGGGADGIHFTLRAGESKIYSVEFRPITGGVPTATMAVRRTDNGQPGLAVPLSGRGVGRR